MDARLSAKQDGSSLRHLVLVGYLKRLGRPVRVHGLDIARQIPVEFLRAAAILLPAYGGS